VLSSLGRCFTASKKPESHLKRRSRPVNERAQKIGCPFARVKLWVSVYSTVFSFISSIMLILPRVSSRPSLYLSERQPPFFSSLSLPEIAIRGRNQFTEHPPSAPSSLRIGHGRPPWTSSQLHSHPLSQEGLEGFEDIQLMAS
jgi:hypothetical protein